MRARSAEGLPRGHGARRVRRAWRVLGLWLQGLCPFNPSGGKAPAPPPTHPSWGSLTFLVAFAFGEVPTGDSLPRNAPDPGNDKRLLRSPKGPSQEALLWLFLRQKPVMKAWASSL